jgi:hypothetical protein
MTPSNTKRLASVWVVDEASEPTAPKARGNWLTLAGMV